MHVKNKAADTDEYSKESVIAQETKPSTLEVDEKLINLIATSVNDVADESGWAFLGEVGNLISKKQPDFDSRNYGFPKLTLLIKSIDRFELEFRKTSNSRIKHIYVRNK
jgi:hypothetical protein